MADSSIAITSGVGTSVDTRTAGGEHRQVVVVGHESVVDSVAAVQATDPSSSALGIVVREPNSTTIVSSLDAVRVRNVIDGTLTTITGVDRVRNIVDGTLTTITGVDRIRNVVDGTISTVTSLATVTRVDRVFNIIDGTISTIPRVDRVFNLVDGTISSGTLDFITRVRNLVDGTLSTVTGVDRIRNIIDGTISLANIQATAVVGAAGGTVAGSTSSVSDLGLTLVSPEVSRRIKVYAFSLTTTAQVGSNVRFTDGNGASPTTFWQVALQAPTQGIAGANLAVTPPGFLFMTAANTTLSLRKDTGSLLHYSISYFKESG